MSIDMNTTRCLLCNMKDFYGIRFTLKWRTSPSVYYH